MANKKQLAGKKTKLAKLPLTRALTGQEPEAAERHGSEELAAVPLSTSPAERVTEAAPSPLAEVYLYLVQELTDLHVCLSRRRNPAHSPEQDAPPWQLPDPLLIELALWRAQQGLRELQTFLSDS
jgi:hypothetical protein